jgi:hypothetical protein
MVPGRLGDAAETGQLLERRPLLFSRELGDATELPPEIAAELCRCFEALLPALRPEYAQILRLDRRVDGLWRAMSLSSVSVIANALRLRAFRVEGGTELDSRARSTAS